MRPDDGMTAVSEARAGSRPPVADVSRAGDAAWLRLRAVSRSHGGRRILDSVDLDIRRGEFFTLLGPSGCGKTTLLRLIGGFDMPDAGAIEMAGKDLARLPASKRPVNTVFQSYALFPHLDVAENVAFGLRMLGRPRREIAARVAEMLDMMRLGDLAGRRIGQLSGGQQQRVALARALAPAPKLLLLDEPLSALDHKLRQEMQVELKRIQVDLGVTFVFVTHDQEEALSMSDRIAIMKGGRILQCDTPQAIYSNPADRFVAGFLGEANFLTGRLRALDCAHATVELMDGQVACVPLGDSAPQPGPVTLMARPEDVALDEGRGVRTRARLTQRSFLGSDHCLHMHLADGTPIRARSRSTPAVEAAQEGEWLAITIAPERLRIVAGDAA